MGTAVKNYGSGASVSGTCTGVASTSIVGVVNCTGSGSGAAATGTLRWEKNTDANTGAGNAAFSTNTGSGSVGATWSVVSDYWATVAVEVQQVSSGGGLSSLLNPPPLNRARLVRASSF